MNIRRHSFIYHISIYFKISMRNMVTHPDYCTPRDIRMTILQIIRHDTVYTINNLLQ